MDIFVFVFGSFAVLIAALMIFVPILAWLSSRQHTSGSASKSRRAAFLLYAMSGEAVLLGLLSFAVDNALRAAGIVLSDVDPSLTHIWAVVLIVAIGFGLTTLIVAVALDPQLRRQPRGR